MFAGGEMLSAHVDTEEFVEGPSAWLEKRKPDFRRFRKNVRKVNKIS
jgi:1,4-dihydroxy-2-naphthoyl-CoA synthase